MPDMIETCLSLVSPPMMTHTRFFSDPGAGLPFSSSSPSLSFMLATANPSSSGDSSSDSLMPHPAGSGNVLGRRWESSH